MYLNFLELPDDDTIEMDLKQAGVLLLAHLDRLATPHLPPQSFNKAVVSGIFNLVKSMHLFICSPLRI